jgi:hypothetical protein
MLGLYWLWVIRGRFYHKNGEMQKGIIGKYWLMIFFFLEVGNMKMSGEILHCKGYTNEKNQTNVIVYV